MAGNKEGGRKAAAKNLARDPDFYKRIGRIGGQKGTTGGFAANRELAREAGRKGGRISKRRSVSSKIEEEFNNGGTDEPGENTIPVKHTSRIAKLFRKKTANNH